MFVGTVEIVFFFHTQIYVIGKKSRGYDLYQVKELRQVPVIKLFC